jgi:hypothetical protein
MIMKLKNQRPEPTGVVEPVKKKYLVFAQTFCEIMLLLVSENNLWFR